MLFITDNFAKNYPKGLSLKFQGATFDTVEISGNKILIGSLTGNEPDMAILFILMIVWESGKADQAFGFMIRCSSEF